MSNRFHKVVFGATVLVACASTAKVHDNQKLYFEIEVQRAGKVIARPKLIGEVGKRLLAERRRPGIEAADYRLSLRPERKGAGFNIYLDLELPEIAGHSEFPLLHGEERRFDLGNRPGELEVSLLVMKVDSTEFRTLMELSRGPAASPGAI
jgi:hypothetical protein